MSNTKKHILFIYLFFLKTLLFSSPADTLSILDNIYNYDFATASERLSKFNGSDPLITETLNLEIRWWMAIGKGNKDLFPDFLYTLNQFEKKETNELTKIISSTYRMRYYACNDMHFMIPFLFVKIQKQVTKIDLDGLKDLSPEGFELFILYKSFLSLVQNSFFLTRVFTDSSVKQELISNIENVIQSGSAPNRTIGRYFLMKYYLDIEKDRNKAFRYLAELHKHYPNNTIFTQLLTN
jgi:hypothetical protein